MPGRMHGTALTRTQRWPRTRRRRRSRPRALENGLAGNRTAGSWPVCNRTPWHNWRSARCWRRFVNRARTGLRHNHSRSRRWWPSLWRRDRRPGRAGLRGRRRSRGTCRQRRSNWRWGGNRRCGHRVRACDQCCGPRLHLRHDHSRRCRRRWSSRRGGWWPHNRHGNRRFNFLRRRRCDRPWRSDRRSRTLLFADDRFQHIPGLGDVRQVNLSLDAFGFRARSASGLNRCAFPGATEMLADSLRFMLFQRTGMRLLLGHPNFGQYVENSFALDFQLSGQIVDSNLTHPPLCASEFTC